MDERPGLEATWLPMKISIALALIGLLWTVGCSKKSEPPVEPPPAPAPVQPPPPDSPESFLKKMQAEPGARTFPSGLVYRETKAGTGASPTAQSTVKVHYRGTLPSGQEFDSSYSRNAPAEFPLGGVIPCWTEGLQQMKVGGAAKLTCPASIAYGPNGHPPVIPPNATLVFEVELLDAH